MDWVTKNRCGLGVENDASEFLQVLIGKIVQDLKVLQNHIFFQFSLRIQEMLSDKGWAGQ